MGTVLFDFQEKGAEWLTQQKYALLADEMGLGKSAQVILAADRLNALPILVLGPAVGRLQFCREFEKFSKRTLNILPLLTAADAKGVPSADVVICSYDLAMTAGVLSQLSARHWSTLVLDEVHFLKAPNTRRTNAVFGSGGLIHRASRVWCMSGTPAPLHPGELWVMLYTLGVTRLSHEEFQDRYTTSVELKVRPGVWAKKVTGSRNVGELRALLKPFMLRRKKEEVMSQLPALRFNEVTVEPAQVDNQLWSMYFDNYLSYGARAREQFSKDIAKAETKLTTLIEGYGLGKDGQMVLEGLAGSPEVKSLRRWVGLQKVIPVAEMIAAELEAGAYEKIVLFAVHRDVIEELEIRLKKFGAVKIYGGTPPMKRDKHVQRFQKDPKCRVFIGQVLAAGTAITLTAAAEIAMVESDWTPGNNAQAIMRVHRIGQTRSVNARFFCMTGYDERITRVLKQRTKMLAEVFDPLPAEKSPFD